MASEGVDLCPRDPDEGQTCRWAVQRKVGGRYAHAECGAPAHLVVEVDDSGEPLLGLPLCRQHLAALAAKVTGYLV